MGALCTSFKVLVSMYSLTGQKREWVEEEMTISGGCEAWRHWKDPSKELACGPKEVLPLPSGGL